MGFLTDMICNVSDPVLDNYSLMILSTVQVPRSWCRWIISAMQRTKKHFPYHSSGCWLTMQLLQETDISSLIRAGLVVRTSKLIEGVFEPNGFSKAVGLISSTELGLIL